MRRLYIGNLASRATKRDIARFFSRYGPLEDILLRDGFGFVELSSSNDAEDAIDDLNGRELCGSRVSLEFAKELRRGARDRYGPPVRTRHRLVVKNLGSDVKWQDLKDLMRRAGDVTFADVHRPSPGEGIVEFESHQDMETALKQYDGYEWHGRRLRLVEDGLEAARSPRRRSSPSRSRSPPRRRRRSPAGSRSPSPRRRSPSDPPRRRRSPSDPPRRRRSPSESPRRRRSPSDGPRRSRSPVDSPRRRRSPSGSPRRRRSPGNENQRKRSRSRSDSRRRRRSASPLDAGAGGGRSRSRGSSSRSR